MLFGTCKFDGFGLAELSVMVRKGRAFRLDTRPVFMPFLLALHLRANASSTFSSIPSTHQSTHPSLESTDTSLASSQQGLAETTVPSVSRLVYHRRQMQCHLSVVGHA